MIIRICQNCKKSFNFRGCPTDIASNRGIYCSRSCVNKGRIFTKEILSKMSLAKIGHVPWNKGKKGYSISSKGIPRPSIQGEKHHLWKGGTSRGKIRRSLEYKKWREDIVLHSPKVCKICGKTVDKYQVDHVLPVSLFPHLVTKPGNGRILCLDCHKRKTNLDFKFITNKFPIGILKEVTRYATI